MFFGHYEHSLDDKGRLLLPRKIKEELKDNSPLYVLKGFEGCLSVYSETEFLKLCEECKKISFNKKNSRSYLTKTIGFFERINIFLFCHTIPPAGSCECVLTALKY